MVRAKFKLTTITTTEYGKGVGSSKKLRFDTVYDKAIPEDCSFSTATPSGTIEMQVDNPAALEQLKIGQSFYVDFTPVPEG